MTHLAARPWLIAGLLCLAATVARAQGTPSARERVYGERLAARLADDGLDAAARTERVSLGGGRGIRVEAPGVTTERLRFRDADEAQAFARAVAADGPGLVEARGNQVLVARGPRLADPVVAEAAREAGWDVLPAPRAAPSVARDLGRERAAIGGARPAAERPANDTYGAVELLRHHLEGEELRELRPRGAAPAVGGGRAPDARSPRERLERALATASGVTIGRHQRGRVQPAYDALSDGDRRAFDDLLATHADRPEVRDQLLKALAASSPVSDIAWLADQLAPHDAAWIDEHTRLTGATGLKQQFSDSCAPTVAQALRGEYDPVYALRTRQGNGNVADVDENDPYRINDPLAREQQTLLEQPYTGQLTQFHGDQGVAAPRATVGVGPGLGTHLDQVMNSVSSATGIEYGYLGTYDDPVTPDAGVDAMREHLAAGRAVPFGITGDDYDGGHAVMATSLRTEGGQPEILVYDPWEGRSTWVPEAQLRSSTFDISGWNRLWMVMEPRS